MENRLANSVPISNATSNSYGNTYSVKNKN